MIKIINVLAERLAIYNTSINLTEYINRSLKQFAERLKEKAMDLALGNVEFNNCLFATDIDETLKEFIND